MRQPIGLVFIAGIVLLGFVRPTIAQERAGAVYMSGGIAVPHQHGVTGEQSVTYVAAPGGTTVGWTVGGGVFATPLVSLEAEVWRTGMMTAREPSRYFTTYNEERRDLFIGGNVRFHTPPRGRVHLEPLVGLCLIHHQGWTTTEQVLFFPEQHIEISPRFPKEHLPESLGLTLGADLHIGGRRLAILPSFRFVKQLLGGTEGDFNLTSNYPGGFPETTLSVGVAARVVF